MEQKLVLKICTGEWVNASRDERELSAYRECGSEVAVLAKGKKNDKGRIEKVDGFTVYRYSTKPLSTRVPNVLNRIVSVFMWAHFARLLKPDVISGHDLGGLSIGWLSTLLSAKKPSLIYDSHEFEIGRNANRNEMQSAFIRVWEKHLINKSAFSIMVNDTIADEVQRIHHLKKRPIVIRSIPEAWKIDNALCMEVRQSIIEQFLTQELDIEKKTSPFLVMYHGALVRNRGIESLIDTAARNPNIYGVVLGNGEREYTASLERLSEEKKVKSRILFLPAVSMKELWKYVGAADLSYMIISDKVKSYYYALPNKFFESIQAQKPILSSKLPEMERLIEQYQIGLSVDGNDPDAINSAVEKFRTDEVFYSLCKENLKNAKNDLTWEKEKEKLVFAYKQLFLT